MEIPDPDPGVPDKDPIAKKLKRKQKFPIPFRESGGSSEETET